MLYVDPVASTLHCHVNCLWQIHTDRCVCERVPPPCTSWPLMGVVTSLEKINEYLSLCKNRHFYAADVICGVVEG